jgi:hypothetical protein
MIEFATKDGRQEGRVDCETFYQHMEDDDGHDECGIMEEEYDCMEMASEYVEFLDECRFTEKYDVCEDEVIECHVIVKVMGERYEGDCQEVADMFGVPLDDFEDECEVTCMDPSPCGGEYEWCEMVECYDHCWEESVCYAEWTDKDGEHQTAECHEMYQQEECDRHGRPEDQCDYEQCDEDCGGNCWIEKCN